MKRWMRLMISFMFVLAFFMPTSAFATSSYGTSNNTSSFASWFSFFFSSETITVKKVDTSYTWNKDEGKGKDKEEDWDGCLKEGKKKQNGCKESVNVWHDYYCGIKVKHDHDDDNYEDDFSWAKKGKWIWVW